MIWQQLYPFTMNKGMVQLTDALNMCGTAIDPLDENAAQARATAGCVNGMQIRNRRVRRGTGHLTMSSGIRVLHIPKKQIHPWDGAQVGLAQCRAGCLEAAVYPTPVRLGHHRQCEFLLEHRFTPRKRQPSAGFLIEDPVALHDIDKLINTDLPSNALDRTASARRGTPQASGACTDISLTRRQNLPGKPPRATGALTSSALPA